MSDTRKPLDVLIEIADTLKAIRVLLEAAAPKPVASARDLDGPYGDPEVRFIPKDWRGDNYKGLRYSACHPAFLDLLAEALDYFAAKAESEHKLTANGKSVAAFNRADAARARGWAKRKREGWIPPDGALHAPLPMGPGFDDVDDGSGF